MHAQHELPASTPRLSRAWCRRFQSTYSPLLKTFSDAVVEALRLFSGVVQLRARSASAHSAIASCRGSTEPARGRGL